MNVLAIVSSHRKNGNTSNVVSLLQEQMEQISMNNGDSIHFETLFLGDYTINHCRGCRVCFDHGEDKCPLKDDIPFIKLKIQEAEAVVFASPVY
ncbi:MAG: flavodoxin family protein, partial [Candidatus Lokiarchaeota archaeon]|nr:flavodoxin family protein [Candidatus Lokiarchaeota archaeon]